MACGSGHSQQQLRCMGMYVCSAGQVRARLRLEVYHHGPTSRLEHAVGLREERGAVFGQHVLEHVLAVDQLDAVVLQLDAAARVEPHDVAVRPPVFADEPDGQRGEDGVCVQPAVAAFVPPVATHLQVANALGLQFGARHARARHPVQRRRAVA